MKQIKGMLLKWQENNFFQCSRTCPRTSFLAHLHSGCFSSS